MKSASYNTNPEIAKSALHIYRDSPLSVRLMAGARTYICPVQPLIDEVPQKAIVFDIGCGNGLFLSVLVDRGKIEGGLGVDSNKMVVESAKKIMSRLLAEKHSNAKINFIAVNKASEWPEALFSCVSMIDVIHHIPPALQEEFFFEAARRVAPGGMLLYKDMCARPLWKALANRLHDLILARQWIHYVPVDRIKKWAYSCGLQIERETSYSILSYGHEKLVFKRKA